MHKIILLAFSLFSLNAVANDFFAKADIEAGKALVEKNCISCHASSYGGDGSEIYTRAFHKVDSSKGLLAQVRACNTNLDLKWFEEDELNASAYLNKAYYKFDQ
ncbi:MAG: c-type cytochrome [Methylophilaceae bacterium]